MLSRLIADAGDLLQEIYSGCGMVLRWQHRDLWSFVGERYIPNASMKRRLSKELVEYFDGTSHYRHPDRGVQSQPLWFVQPKGGGWGRGGAGVAGGRAVALAAAADSTPGVPNMRRVIELPNALLQAEEYGQLCELLSDLDLFQIMDQSGTSVSKHSGDGRELGHGHGRETLHAVWAEAEVRSKAAKEAAFREVERVKEELKKPKPPAEPAPNKGGKAGAPATAAAAKKAAGGAAAVPQKPKNPVAEAEAAAAAAVVVDMGESYLRAVRRLQARYASEHASAASGRGGASFSRTCLVDYLSLPSPGMNTVFFNGEDER